MPDLVETLVAHELAYSYLSRVFYEPPDKALMATLAADDLFHAWPIETDQPEVETGLALLQQFCASWREDDLEALQHDYRRLFVGPGRLLATPWESVYRSPEHLLFGIHTIQVRQSYERFGMATPHLHSEPDDHLGLELRFIAHLCAVGLGALERQDADTVNAAASELHRFLNTHLLRWSSECLRLVIENARSDYFRGCAHLTLGCLMHTDEVFRLETAR